MIIEIVWKKLDREGFVIPNEWYVHYWVYQRRIMRGEFYKNWIGSWVTVVSCYSNFLPYVTSDHCPAMLVMADIAMKKRRSFRFMNYLADKKDFHRVVKDHWNKPVKGFAMFVLEKRLKGMKKHLRELNKKNGNVHDKVKRLRDELKKVQVELDKDPNNSDLREAEMVFNKAYREVALDEEKVLKQKSKVNWLKEGDLNTAYFHNLLKGRKNKSRIVSIKYDMGNEFHDDQVA
ncbi:hypothetical protein Tco_0624150 [Tanacetum coccineum]|uniref:RNA-directed DNA polymerase, eukaryota, reverse transcriptase zinc-binding domain protein n=1 Tax=Tanacetum coccineum TaxID=301880 RepID=A0ABQ4WD84_9ASTR